MWGAAHASAVAKLGGRADAGAASSCTAVGFGESAGADLGDGAYLGDGAKGGRVDRGNGTGEAIGVDVGDGGKGGLADRGNGKGRAIGVDVGAGTGAAVVMGVGAGVGGRKDAVRDGTGRAGTGTGAGAGVAESVDTREGAGTVEKSILGTEGTEIQETEIPVLQLAQIPQRFCMAGTGTRLLVVDPDYYTDCPSSIRVTPTNLPHCHRQ